MLLLLLSLISSSVWPDTIPVLHLEFDQTQWEFACANYYEDIYIPVELTYNGAEFQCQFRIRGATSRSYPKKSIKIELPQGLFLFGKDELNLNAEFLDMTRMRECLSYLFYSETGQIVPEVHFVEVVFNGETQGAYLSVEDVDKDFLLTTQLPDNGVIYKCSDRYTTLDRINDLDPYSKKTHESQPWDDFLLLLHWLSLCPDELFYEQLQERFHYDDLISCVATNVLIGHGSTYYHNYSLILDDTGQAGQWRYITWDMDRTWGKYGPEFPYSRNSSNTGHRRNKLLWRMWCNKIIREELFSEIDYQFPLFLRFVQGNTIDSIAQLIAPLIQQDPFRDYSMDDFWGMVASLYNWPESRYSNVLNQIEEWPLPFRIANLQKLENNILVSWQNAGNSCSWRLVISSDSLFANPLEVVFETFPSDTFYTVPSLYTGSDLWLQVYATRNGVEHRSNNGPIISYAQENYSITGDLVINEINYLSNSVFNPGDWFEIINTDNQTISMAGWSIRDANRTNLTTVDQLIIDPGQCLVFSSDSLIFLNTFERLPNPSQSLNFNLSDNDDMIKLIDPTGNTIDSIYYSSESPWPWQAAGYGSTLALLNTSLPNQFPASWIAGSFGGTPFLPDIYASDWPGYGAVSFSLRGPVPVAGDLSIDLLVIASVVTEISLYDLSGRIVLPLTVTELTAGESTITLKTSSLASGVYFVGVRNMGFLQTKKITVLNSL